MDDKKSLEIFESSSAGKAVLQNTFPAMAAMLMVLIYNLADTFFIGQTHDAFFSPFMIESQNLALSFSPTYIPRTSFFPFMSMPRAI